jgi:hypothetical protein
VLLFAVSFLATEQLLDSKFCFKLGETPTETYEVLHNVYGDEALSRSNVSEWLKRFKDGREDHQNGPRCGRPSTFRNADTIANNHEVVTRDH